MSAIVLLSVNQHTKFEVPSLTDSKDMTHVPVFIKRQKS